MIAREFDYKYFNGIILIGNDLTVHEFINGLLKRSDWEKAIQIPITFISNDFDMKCQSFNDPILSTFRALRNNIFKVNPIVYIQDQRIFYGFQSFKIFSLNQKQK